MSPQEFWHDKCRELTPPPADKRNGRTDAEMDAPARAWLIAELRALADHIETGKYPDVMGCIIPEGGVAYKGGFVATWTVQLSHLWGG
jgi:hypothetical protein